MTRIFNLGVFHDYSLDATIIEFVKVANRYSKGCLGCMPGMFQNLVNHAWVRAQLQLNYKTLIEPYKLGLITTKQFLDGLSRIFYFMAEMDVERRHAILSKAFSSSIKIGAHTQGRFNRAVETATADDPLVIISNTNPLDAVTILLQLQSQYRHLRFNKVDLDARNIQEPIRLMEHVFLFLSFQVGKPKSKLDSTMTLIDKLRGTPHLGAGSMTLISQYEPDRKKAQALGMMALSDEDYFTSLGHTNNKIS